VYTLSWLHVIVLLKLYLAIRLSSHKGVINSVISVQRTYTTPRPVPNLILLTDRGTRVHTLTEWVVFFLYILNSTRKDYNRGDTCSGILYKKLVQTELTGTRFL